MSVVLEKITETCSMDCSHCPYANSKKNNNEDFNFIAESETIYILSGGEPFESLQTLKKYIQEICNKGSYFRIATGGHIQLRYMYMFLLNMSGFLGINFVTDILLRSNNNTAQKNWEYNWKLFSKLNSTWLTITLGKDVDMGKVIKILKNTSPKLVMINEEESGFLEFENELRYLMTEFNEITFIEGYRHEGT